MGAPNSLDHCPVCGRRIYDFDMTGCEGDDAQRWCVAHLPEDHPQAYLKTVDGQGPTAVISASDVAAAVNRRTTVMAAYAALEDRGYPVSLSEGTIDVNAGQWTVRHVVNRDVLTGKPFERWQVRNADGVIEALAIVQ